MRWGWSAASNGTADAPYDYDEQFNGSNLRCGGEYPDINPTAFHFRDTDGQDRVQINLGHEINSRRLLGSSLSGTIRRENAWHQMTPGDTRYRDCSTPDWIYHAVGDTTPTSFTNKEWLASQYYEVDSGNTPRLYALGHNEYKWPATSCPDTPFTVDGDGNQLAKEARCWYAAITMFTSDPNDSLVPALVKDRFGAWYRHPTGGVQSYLVAAPRYQYCENFGRVGPHHFTNVLKRWEDTDGDGQADDPAYYFMTGDTAPQRACDTGQPLSPSPAGQTCIFRTTDLSDADSWRAWDGQGYTIAYSSPYPTGPNPVQRCVAPSQHMSFPWNITYNTYLRKYMQVTWDTGPNGKTGVYYYLSDDLHNWSDKQLIVEPDQETACEGSMPYTSLFDPLDPAASANPTAQDTPASPNNVNYDHPGRRPQLWSSRANQTLSGGKCVFDTSAGTDLVRTPIKFEQKQSTFESGGINDSDRGFTTNTANVTLTSGADYDPDSSNKFVRTTTNGSTSGWAYGRNAVNWNDGDDVWYGAAYFIPEGFASASGQIDILNWRSTGDNGGIALTWNDKYQLMRQEATRTLYGPEFDLPTRRWVWVEVHQRLGTTNALSEVYVDGRLVASSTDANRGSSQPITLMRYGIVNVVNPGGATQLDVDRASVMGGQLGAHIGTADYQAPKTPLGLRKVVASNQDIWLTWNGPRPGEPAVSGYRLYEQLSNGTWDKIVDTAGTVALDTVDPGSCGHKYRITAYRNTTDALVPPNPLGTNVSESIYSSTVTANTSNPSCPPVTQPSG
jgi:hypothetical protein